LKVPAYWWFNTDQMACLKINLISKDVEAQAGSGPFSVEAEAQNSTASA